MTAAGPVVLDSSVLVAYERMRSTGSAVLSEAQDRVLEWIEEGKPLIVPALSLTVAAQECDGALPELEFLANGNPDLVRVVPLARKSAVRVGGRCKSAEDFETSHVVWCAGGDDWPVVTFWPDWYAGTDVPVIEF